MTKTVDVAAGQKVASTWGNEVRDRTLQVFASKAELDAQWPGGVAPNGAHAVTLDTGLRWSVVGGAWVVTPGQRVGSCNVACGGADIVGPATLATFDFGVSPVQRLVHAVMHIAGTQISSNGSTSLALAFTGGASIGHTGPNLATGALDGILLAGVLTVAAGASGVLTGSANRVNGTGAYRLTVDGRFSYMSALAFT